MHIHVSVVVICGVVWLTCLRACSLVCLLACLLSYFVYFVELRTLSPRRFGASPLWRFAALGHLSARPLRSSIAQLLWRSATLALSHYSGAQPLCWCSATSLALSSYSGAQLLLYRSVITLVLTYCSRPPMLVLSGAALLHRLFSPVLALNDVHFTRSAILALSHSGAQPFWRLAAFASLALSHSCDWPPWCSAAPVLGVLRQSAALLLSRHHPGACICATHSSMRALIHLYFLFTHSLTRSSIYVPFTSADLYIF